MSELTRRGFIKFAGAAAAITALPNYVSAATNKKAVAGTGGNQYVPYAQRKSPAAFVYFTRDLSANGLVKIFDRVKGVLAGKVAVKLHTGEPHGPNIIPRPWVKELIASRLPDASIKISVLVALMDALEKNGYTPTKDKGNGALLKKNLWNG